MKARRQRNVADSKGRRDLVEEGENEFDDEFFDASDGAMLEEEADAAYYGRDLQSSKGGFQFRAKRTQKKRNRDIVFVNSDDYPNVWYDVLASNDSRCVEIEAYRCEFDGSDTPLRGPGGGFLMKVVTRAKRGQRKQTTSVVGQGGMVASTGKGKGKGGGWKDRSQRRVADSKGFDSKAGVAGQSTTNKENARIAGYYYSKDATKNVKVKNLPSRLCTQATNVYTCPDDPLTSPYRNRSGKRLGERGARRTPMDDFRMCQSQMADRFVFSDLRKRRGQRKIGMVTSGMFNGFPMKRRKRGRTTRFRIAALCEMRAEKVVTLSKFSAACTEDIIGQDIIDQDDTTSFPQLKPGQPLTDDSVQLLDGRPEGFDLELCGDAAAVSPTGGPRVPSATYGFNLNVDGDADGGMGKFGISSVCEGKRGIVYIEIFHNNPGQEKICELSSAIFCPDGVEYVETLLDSGNYFAIVTPESDDPEGDLPRWQLCSDCDTIQLLPSIPTREGDPAVNLEGGIGLPSQLADDLESGECDEDALDQALSSDGDKEVKTFSVLVPPGQPMLSFQSDCSDSSEEFNIVIFSIDRDVDPSADEGYTCTETTTVKCDEPNALNKIPIFLSPGAPGAGDGDATVLVTVQVPPSGGDASLKVEAAPPPTRMPSSQDIIGGADTPSVPSSPTTAPTANTPPDVQKDNAEAAPPPTRMPSSQDIIGGADTPSVTSSPTTAPTANTPPDVQNDNAEAAPPPTRMPSSQDIIGGADTPSVTSSLTTAPTANTPPDVQNDNTSTDEESPVPVDLLDNDTDPDGNPLTVINIAGTFITEATTIPLPSGAILVVDDSGAYTYDPNGLYDSLGPGETAVDTFQYTVSDGQDGQDTATVTISITGNGEPTTAPVSSDPTTAPVSSDPTTAPVSSDPTSSPASLATTSAPVSSGPTSSPATPAPNGAPASSGPTSSPVSSAPTGAPVSSDPTTAPASLDPATAPASSDPTSSPASLATTSAPISSGPTSSPATPAPNGAPASSGPTSSPVSSAPSGAPVSSDPTTAPASLDPATAPASSGPTSSPASLATTSAPISSGPTSSPATPAPNGAPASSGPTSSPVSSAPSGAPVSSDPTTAPVSSDPATAPASSGPTSSPASLATTSAPISSGPTSSPATPAPNGAPASSGPTSSPVSSAPSGAPVSSDPTTAPVSSDPATAPASSGPTSSPASLATTSAPISSGPTSSPATPAPNGAPASSGPTSSPVSSAPSGAPVSSDPTTAPASLDPTTAPASSGPTSAPVADVAKSVRVEYLLTYDDNISMFFFSFCPIVLPQLPVNLYHRRWTRSFLVLTFLFSLQLFLFCHRNKKISSSSPTPKLNLKEETLPLTEPGNTPPDAQNDSESTNPLQTVSSTTLQNDTDPENDTLTVKRVNGSPVEEKATTVIVTLPSGAIVSVSSSGQYTYDPNSQFDSLDEGDEGFDTFTYTISDGNGGTDEATVTILMPGVNDPPVAENDDYGKVGSDAPLSDNVFDNDSDPEADDLTVTSIGGEDVDPTGSTTITLPSGAIMTIDGDTGDFTLDPNGQFDSLDHSETATVTVEYGVSDGNGGTDSATVTLTLTGNNTAPYAEDDSKTTLPTTAVSDTMTVNDSDPESDTLVVTLVEGSVEPDDATGVAVATLPSGAIVSVSSSGQYTYDPNSQFDSLDEGDEGFDTFTYTISDGNGGTDEATVTILMPGVNDAPVAEE